MRALTLRLTIKRSSSCFFFLLLLCILHSQPGQAQISGPATACANVQYTYTPGTIYSKVYNWYIEGGTIVRGANTRSVVVQWNNGGGKLMLEYYSADLGDYFFAQTKVVKTYKGGVVNGPSTVCKNLPFSVSLSNNIGPVDHWEYAAGNGAWVAISGTNNLTSYTSSGIITSTSFRVVINGSSCMEYATPFTVNVVQPGAGPAVTNATSCTPGAVTLYANGTGMTYNWYAADGSRLKSGLDNYYTTPGLSNTTTYYVSSVPFQGCESNRTPVIATIDVVGVPPVPTVNTKCGSILLSTTTAPQGYTYYWQTTYDGTSTAHAELTHDPKVSYKDYYLRTRSNATGCWSASASVFLPNVNIPAAPPIPTVTQQCRMVTVSSIVPNPKESIAYYWQTAATGTSTINGGPTYQPPGAGTYYLRAKKYSVADDCWSAATPVVVTIQPQSCLEGQNMNYVVTNTIRKEGVRREAEIPKLILNDLSQSVSYMDGLGRTIQNVIPLGAPSQKDNVQILRYDRFGRQSQTYLPFTAGMDGKYKENALNALALFYSTSGTGNDRATTATPWAETIFETSPLDKVIEQSAAGEAWQTGTGHTVTTTTRPNVAAEVRKWEYDFTNGQSTTGDFYQAGELMVTEVKNAAGNKTWKYTNKLGKVVLAKNEVSSAALAETYYVYDAFSRLRMVIQPEGVKVLLGNNWQLTADLINKWCFTYKYDNLGRLTEKKLPGAAPISFVYNKRDLPVLTQDGDQRQRNQWSFIKYNALGRPVMTGVYAHSTMATQEQMQQAADIQANQFEERTTVAYPIQFGYTIDHSFPVLVAGNSVIYTVTYYDDYNFDNDATVTPDLMYQPAGFDQEPVTGSELTGKITGTRVKVLGSNKTLLTTLFYDKWGQVIQEQSENYLGGQDIITNRYNFTGEIVETRHSHQTLTTQITVTKQFLYDNAGRLLQVKQQNNNDVPVTLASYRYNELGQSIEKKLHSTDGINYLQQLNYRYNIRGWLNRINDAGLNGGTGLFGMEMRYNEGSISRPGTAFYDGNIAEIIFNNRRDDQPGAYVYNYDRSGRITSARYTAKTATGWNAHIDEFNEEGIFYDLNGNINSMQRYAPLETAEGKEKVDDLTYTYSGNQLVKVEDGGAATRGFINGVNEGIEYNYDLNGNLIADRNNGIQITYNHRNLIDTVFKNTGDKIVYTYDATGNKVAKTVLTASGAATVHYYIRGFEYNNDRQLEFFPTEEGRVVKQGTGYNYEYKLTDHLGNVWVSFDKDPVTGQARIIQKNGYYPFGGAHPGAYVSGLANKYLYNGKELQDDLGLDLYDFGVRMYDAKLGRWHTIDAKADKYPGLSPYNFCLNNPVLLTDPDGRDPVITITNQEAGMAKIKLIGTDDSQTGAYETIEVPLYKATVTDDEDASFYLQTMVTRDSWAVDKDYGNEAIISNRAFEPADANKNEYTGQYIDVYPKENNTAAYVLNQDGDAELQSDLRKSEKGEMVTNAKNIMIHVGGIYENEKDGTFNDKPRIRAGGSYGCFGIVNSGNSMADPSDAEANRVIGEVRRQSDKDSSFGYSKVKIIIQKREKVEREKTVPLSDKDKNKER